MFSLLSDTVKVKETRSSTLEGSNANDIEDAFQEVITSRRKRKLNKGTKTSETDKKLKIDLEHYIPYKPSDDVTEKGYAFQTFK